MKKINLRQDDETIYRQARTRVILRLVFSYLFLIVYFIASYMFLHLDFFQIGRSALSPMLLMILIGGQLALYLVLFLMLGTGSRIFRVFYWICFVFELCLTALPGYFIATHISRFMVYAAMIACMLIKISFLYNLGKALGKNRWCRVYFDYVIEVDEDEDEDEEDDEIYQPIRKRPVRVEEEFYDTEDEYEEEEKAPYTYPQISVRLGICVYGSLMVFPILVQIFSGFFISSDMTNVFATRDIFILAIISAVIWTIPIFFLYYDHPSSKRIVLGCVLAEIITLLAYSPRFIGYVRSGDYAWRVFVLFALVDIVRYLLIYVALKPLKDHE